MELHAHSILVNIKKCPVRSTVSYIEVTLGSVFLLGLEFPGNEVGVFVALDFSGKLPSSCDISLLLQVI